MTTKQRNKELDESTPIFGEVEQAAERRQREPRERQHPALVGKPDVEVAERTADTSDDSTGEHTKDFVTTRVQWASADHDESHRANIAAVRQYMVANGLRPDADVTFDGEHDHPWDEKSLVLRYKVSAIPAAVAFSFDQRHVVIPQTGETGTDRAEHDAARETRLKAGHDAKREGTAEGDRPASKSAREKEQQEKAKG